MSQTIEPLILDLLEWIGPGGRPYTEVIDAWRTSCPRLPVWEEAIERGLVAQRYQPARGAFVSVTAQGVEHLRKSRAAGRQVRR